MAGKKKRKLEKKLQQKRDKVFASDILTDEISRLGGERGAFQNLRSRHIGAVGNSANRLRQELGQNTSLRLAQEDRPVGGSFRGALDSATRRMKARQGISNRGEEAIRSQGLRDRLEIARGSLARRGKFQQSLQQGANIREGVNIGVQNANQAIAESNADLLGGVTGAATGFLSDKGNRAKIGGFFKNLFGGGGAAAPIGRGP